MATTNDRRIDYIEFYVQDVARAKRFYGDCFGWTFEDYGPDYAAFNDGRMNGGFAASAMDDAGNPGGSPLIVLYAADLEALEKKVVQAGGKITRPTFDFPGGRRFHFTDPGGNELAVWSEQKAK